MGYHLKGELLEVCDCNTLCPCWIGENPDNGTCQSFMKTLKHESRRFGGCKTKAGSKTACRTVQGTAAPSSAKTCVIPSFIPSIPLTAISFALSFAFYFAPATCLRAPVQKP